MAARAKSRWEEGVEGKKEEGGFGEVVLGSVMSGILGGGQGGGWGRGCWRQTLTRKKKKKCGEAGSWSSVDKDSSCHGEFEIDD